MDKWELIKKYKELEENASNIETRVACRIFLQDLEQLDEPQPVKVTQFAADWYEENKDDFEFNVWDWIAFRNEPEKLENKEFNDWINDGEGTPIQTLVNMHQFGYEVEEEKKFFVKIKCLSEEYKYLNYFKSCREWLFSQKEETEEYRTAHTRKELEEYGFGWVFSCEGIEIEEVE